jgi:hypothetical protein
VLRRAKLRAASPAEPGAPKRFAKAKTTKPKSREILTVDS